MFADLTPAELGSLRSKLYSAGHKFGELAGVLGREALALPPLSTEHDTIWAARRPVASAMYEAYDLAEATEATEAAR